MGNWPAGIGGAILFLALAGFFGRAGVRSWRSGGAEPFQVKMTFFSQRVSDALDRSAIATSIVTSVGAVMVLVVTALRAGHAANVSDTRVIAGVAAGVFLLALVHLLGIIWFNRPRFLVPPHRRHERGTMVLWWDDRKAKQQ
jgi:hypothetical protein